MFIPAKTSRISTNIVDQIRKAILSGELKPGDRLPSEKELAENFGVSKASLREAFRALEALGLTVHFIDNWDPYHVCAGEVHCGTNAVRRVGTRPWWHDVA
jgi:hypothetical protein